MINIKNKIKSVRIKLFFTLCIIISMIVVLLILLNSIVIEKFYLYNKTKNIKDIYEEINTAYNNHLPYDRIQTRLEYLSINNNLDIIIKTNENILILTTKKYGVNSSGDLDILNKVNQKIDFIKELYDEESINIKLVKEKDTNINYIFVTSQLDNGYELYIMTSVEDLKESAKVSNTVLIYIGTILIVVSGILSSFVSKKFTAPILELDAIAQKMSNLDFSQRYQIDNTEDEINNLGKSINTMSDKLEKTIKQLTVYNTELEKDIERKSKIDEMRKQFISDVSHELKTPIALIQGYAEGLVEEVNTDEESRKFYAEVILDEANKMDRLVKQLLELMKIEYGKLDLNNESFDIVNLIKEVIKKCNVILEENNIKVEFDCNNIMMAYADVFYIEQILMNYFTNAIKYSKEVAGEKKIEVNILLDTEKNKLRVSIFNTGDQIAESELQKIWGRFYKIDASRNRENGGTGIGLAYVKAIMNNYKNEYGAINKENGIEFFFDVDMEK